MIDKAFCFFEQSGTFKREFIKLGIPSCDVDILNDFGETDFELDIFAEIDKAYENGVKGTIFEKLTPNSLIFAFFPCVRFCEQGVAHIKANSYHFTQKGADLKERIAYGLMRFNEMAHLFNLLNKLVLLALDCGFKLIIENPQHNLLDTIWHLKPAVKIKNRAAYGDYFAKPTQFYFINFEPQNNFIFENIERKPISTNKHFNKNDKDFVDLIENKFGENTSQSKTIQQRTRSLMSPEFANRFIREFILENDGVK